MKPKKFLPLLPILFLLSGCNKNKGADLPDPASELFISSANAILEFTKQLEHAKDSLEVDSISIQFEKELIRINFSFPPQTDYKISEQDNDSLYKLLTGWRIAKDNVLNRLSKFKTDSLEYQMAD